MNLFSSELDSKCGEFHNVAIYMLVWGGGGLPYIGYMVLLIVIVPSM